MIEQLSLFGERDTLSIVLEWLTDMYEYRKSQLEHWEGHPNFDKWLLDCFASHQGGTTFGIVGSYGWTLYNMSPKGIELVDTDSKDWRRELIPKAKILRAFGIKDDKRDLLKEQTDEID